MLFYNDIPAANGSSETLVILHGLFGTGDNWITLARHWSQHYRVILPDARNHGHSFQSDIFDYPAMALDLNELVVQLGLTKFHLMGHSMGAKTSMYYALQHGNSLQSLSLIDMSIFRNQLDHQKVYLRAMADLDLEQMNSRTEVDQALSTSIPDFGIRQFLLKSLTRNEHKQFAWRLNLPVFLTTVDAIGEGIPTEGTFEGPTLFLRGGKSDYVKDSDWPLILERFPNAELQTIPQAGHWVHADSPQEFSSIFLPFIQKHSL